MVDLVRRSEPLDIGVVLQTTFAVIGRNFGTFLIVYTLGPIIGGLIAGLAIRFIYSNDLEEAEGIVPPREDVIEIETDTPPGAPA